MVGIYRRRRTFPATRWRAWSCRSVWEQSAFERGGGDYCAPDQLVGDFLGDAPSTALGDVDPSYRPGVNLGDLSTALPAYAIDAIREALPAFGRQIRGFDRDDAVLTGIEIRTSSPVRITPDPDRSRA